MIGNYPDAGYILRNSFFNNDYAMALKRSIWNGIYYNIIEDGNYGIYFQGEGLDLEETIENNNMSGNNYGIYVNDQDSIILNNNYFCSPNSINDIYLFSSTSNEGSENRCENSDGWNDNGVTGCTYYCYGPPTVTLLYPPNNYEYNEGNIAIICESEDNTQLVNFTLYHNISGTWQANQTTNISGTSNTTTFNINNLESGTNFIWNCLVYDNMSRSSFASANWSVSINIIPQDTHKFYVKNSSNNPVAWLGNFGNIVLKGKCFSGGNCNTPGPDSFIVRNITDSNMAFINSSGDLCIIKGDCSDESVSCNPTRTAFIVRNSSDYNMSYIDFDGELCLTGKLYENSGYL